MGRKRFDRKFGDEFLRSIPAEPGVYLWRGEQGEILYVGKAKHLRRRIDAIDGSHTVTRQPRSGSASATAKISTAFNLVPTNRLQLAEQPNIHVVFDGVLVGCSPP